MSAWIAALGDSAEWMHNFFKRHDDKSVFFKRDYSQQRPVDIAEFFQAFRAQKWIERLQAEEVMRAEALDVPQQIMELLAQHKLDFETLFDQMEGTQMPSRRKIVALTPAGHMVARNVERLLRGGVTFERLKLEQQEHALAASKRTPK